MNRNNFLIRLENIELPLLYSCVQNKDPHELAINALTSDRSSFRGVSGGSGTLDSLTEDDAKAIAPPLYE